MKLKASGVTLARAMGVCGLVCGCGGKSSADAPPLSTSPFCQQWPEDQFYCDGPLLSAEDAAVRVNDSQVVGPEAVLVGVRSSPNGGLTPDGDQSLGAGGWLFTFAYGNGSRLEVQVNANAVETEIGMPMSFECGDERIVVDGLSEHVKAAAELVEATYAAKLIPGTFAIHATREAACIASSGFARTVVDFQLDVATERFPSVEFDGSGRLVGTCAVGGQLRGCRGD